MSRKQKHNPEYCSAYDCCNRQPCTLIWCDKIKSYIGLHTMACAEHGKAINPDHEEEVFIRDCIAWRETDPIFNRTKIVFHTLGQEAQIHKEIYDHFRSHPLSNQELPRAQPCQGFYTGEGATIKVKVPQYARQ